MAQSDDRSSEIVVRRIDRCRVLLWLQGVLPCATILALAWWFFSLSSSPQQAPGVFATGEEPVNSWLWVAASSALALAISSVATLLTHRRLAAANALLREREERLAIALRSHEDAARAEDRTKARLHAISDAAPDGILMTDSAGRISFWNPAAERILGYPAGEALTRDLHELLTPAQYVEGRRQTVSRLPSTDCATAGGHSIELRVRCKDGQEITVALSLSATHLGGDWHTVGILHDITRQKQDERDLRRAKEDLEQNVLALQTANKALEQFNAISESATRAKSEFLANMSHEIRTPITAILGYSEIMIEENYGRATREHAVVIQRNAKHLLELINDILDLSKVEAGRMEFERTRCSPFEIVEDVVALMRVRAESKHLNLQVDFTGALPESVLTVPLRLRQVLVNLVGNAIKFTDQGSVEIGVRLIAQDGRPQLRFDVRDTGIGMSREQVAQLFQPFTQVDGSSTRRFGGTGLGLAISKRLVEAMGGIMQVTSAQGAGSTFSMTIDPGPLDGVGMVRYNGETGLIASPPSAQLPHDALQHVRVLLAEDGPDNQRLIRFLLTKAGAEVVTVENGQLALGAAKQAIDACRPFDVILMDMQMPVMDGYTATRELRAVGYANPILALTAHAMAEDRQKCITAGCSDYVSKPVEREQLLRVVAEWATRSEAVAG